MILPKKRSQILQTKLTNIKFILTTKKNSDQKGYSMTNNITLINQLFMCNCQRHTQKKTRYQWYNHNQTKPKIQFDGNVIQQIL